MESLQQLKLRLKGVKNINQITKAMELVAATKMRRSQETALMSRPYAFASLDLLSRLSKMEGVVLPPLLQTREVKRTAVLVVTSDKGLAGSFNNAVFRELERYMKREGVAYEDETHTFIAVGAKALAYLEKRVKSIDSSFIRVGDFTTIPQIQPIAAKLTDGFLAGSWDHVITFSTHFRSAISQEVLEREIFPVSFENLKAAAEEIVPERGKFADMVKQQGISLFTGETLSTEDYIIEPSAAAALEALASHLVLTEVYHLILEANASEHAARRTAMKSASDNAKEIAGELSVLYNKSRQAAITKEIIEIVAGAESLT